MKRRGRATPFEATVMKSPTPHLDEFEPLAFSFDSAASDLQSPEEILKLVYQIFDLSGSVQLKLRLAHSVLSQYFKAVLPG